MDLEKVKDQIILFSGFISSIYLALKSYGIEAEYINPERVGLLTNVVTSAVPLAFAMYGVYKNTHVLTRKGRRQKEVLKRYEEEWRHGKRR